MFGFDVYTAEVDDHGSDFVVRTRDSKYYDIQVKTMGRSGYVYFVKRKFEIGANRLVALVMLNDGRGPEVFLIPTHAMVDAGRNVCGPQLRRAEERPRVGASNSRADESIRCSRSHLKR